MSLKSKALLGVPSELAQSARQEQHLLEVAASGAPNVPGSGPWFASTHWMIVPREKTRAWFLERLAKA